MANLAISMSVNPEKVKMVRLAAIRLKNLCPQVRMCSILEDCIMRFKPGQTHHVILLGKTL